MSELLLVCGLLGSLVGGAALLSRTPWEWLFGGGLLLTALGLLLGVPTGLLYHVRLHRAVRKHGSLPRSWWLRPVELHARIGAAERGGVLWPFYAGALGFALSIFGCVCVAVGAFRAPPG